MEDVRSWLRPLEALPLRRMTFSVTLAAPVEMNDPLCATVRGLAAAAFRAQRCLTGARSCEGCTEVARCDYAALVGTRDTGDEAPRPWWLDGVPGTSSAAKGARWRVSLTVVDDGRPRGAILAASLVGALERVGVTGPLRHAVTEGSAAPLTWTTPPAGPLRIVTMSPWLVRLEGGDGLARSELRCPEAPWLALLAGSIARRCDAVARTFGGASLGPLRLPDLRGIRCVEGGLSPWRGSRFSHAQNRRMPLEGFAGEALLEGEGIDAVAPLLAAGALLGAGRLRALGFGSLRVHAGA